MTDQQISPAGIVIPDEAKQKYPKIVALILASESMNTEERNYWLQVLPVMTPEQVKELEDILSTEKKKLAAIDAKYDHKNKQNTPEINLAEVERKRKQAQEERKTREQAHRTSDEQSAEALLLELENL